MFSLWAENKGTESTYQPPFLRARRPGHTDVISRSLSMECSYLQDGGRKLTFVSGQGRRQMFRFVFFLSAPGVIHINPTLRWCVKKHISIILSSLIYI